MGDKKLKAIAVKGTKDLNIAKPAEFYELCGRILKKSERQREFVANWSRERAEFLIGRSAYGNLGEKQPMENIADRHEAFLEQYRRRRVACYNCALECKQAIRLPDGAYSFIKCFSWHLFITISKIQDFSFDVRCYHLCEKYGLDSVSTACLVAFAIDLYEKGILTSRDTEGMSLEWGNEEVVLTLIGKIARREGIGDILANGVYEAAHQIGRGAEQYAYHTKKLEMASYPRPYSGLLQAISDGVDFHKLLTAGPPHTILLPKEKKKQYIESEFWRYPEEFKKLIWDDYDPTGSDYERITKMVSFDQNANTMSDITGICVYWTGFWDFNPYLFDDQMKLISYATGRDIDEDEGMKIAKRVVTLTRAYNVRLGITRKDDTVPERFFHEQTPPSRFPKPLDRVTFNKALDSYYKLRGYNKGGIPSQQTLDELDLGYASEDLLRRGVLPDEEGILGKKTKK